MCVRVCIYIYMNMYVYRNVYLHIDIDIRRPICQHHVEVQLRYMIL